MPDIINDEMWDAVDEARASLPRYILTNHLEKMVRDMRRANERRTTISVEVLEKIITALAPTTQPCPECHRSVFVENRPATGFIAKCGRRLSKISECSAKGCPTTQGTDSGLADELAAMAEAMHALNPVLCDPSEAEANYERASIAFSALRHRARTARLDTTLAPTTQGTDSGLAEYLDGLPVRARHYKYSDPISGKSVWRNECGTWNGQQPKGSVDLYDRQTVETALRSRTDRKAVLEEAAKVKRLLDRAIGFIEGVKRGGHWIGPSWGDETNLLIEEVRALAEGNAQ